MPEYKLFTYSSDIEVDEEFYLNSTVEDDNIKVEEILKDWLPLEKAIAILDGVSTYGIWLGIGKRPDEVVSRWKEIRPWLPDKISIPKLVNGKAQILTVTEAEAAPITQKVLYKEVEKARKLNDLCES